MEETSLVQRQELIEYYKEKGLLIVGMNDSQGMNANFTFFRKGLLRQLADALTGGELTPTVIDAFSLTMNKTEHIDYFLKHNLTLEEIKLSQIYSAVSALKKTMQDMHLPTCLGEVGNVFRMMYPIEPNDKNIHLSSALKSAKEPIVIYSSGINNLMREVGNNPFAIRSDYKNRSKRPNYYYTWTKSMNKDTVPSVIDAIKQNYETLLGINSNADIYALGAYVPKALECSVDGMSTFRNLIFAYNQQLEELCKQYGVEFVNMESIGNHYNHSKINFHISTGGHSEVAKYILSNLHSYKIAHSIPRTRIEVPTTEIIGLGSIGVSEESMNDLNKSINRLEALTGYERKREQEIIEERKREVKIMRKTYEHVNRC